MEIEELKLYLKQNGITYEDVARVSGLSISTIKKIFAGISKYPRIDTMQAIEHAVGLSNENISDLTYEEKQIIKDYRLLDKRGQKLVKDALAALKK